MRQFPEPPIEIMQHRGALGEECEIASVDQHVAIWNNQFPMQFVRIAHADDAH
jgi:hypothetical protein